MTDYKELIEQLRNSKGWPTLGNAAADALEAAHAEATAAALGAEAVDQIAKAKNLYARALRGDCISHSAMLKAAEKRETISQEISALTPQSARDWLAEHDKQVRAEERERCVQIAEMNAPHIEWDTNTDDQAHAHYCNNIAAEIRASEGGQTNE